MTRKVKIFSLVKAFTFGWCLRLTQNRIRHAILLGKISMAAQPGSTKNCGPVFASFPNRHNVSKF